LFGICLKKLCKLLIELFSEKKDGHRVLFVPDLTQRQKIDEVASLAQQEKGLQILTLMTYSKACEQILQYECKVFTLGYNSMFLEESKFRQFGAENSEFTNQLVQRLAAKKGSVINQFL
jgi:hypothetical protein